MTLLSFIVFLVCAPTVKSQDAAVKVVTTEPTMMIDRPTAGMLHRGNYRITSDFFEEGGVLFGVSVGLLDKFDFGISYGGTNILGKRKPEMNPYPGVNVRLRILEETTAIPAVAIGFDWQGRGPYDKDKKRYQVKSPGFYAVASQNYSLAGNLSLHGGINLSTETGDGDKDMDVFVGAEKSIGTDFSALAEYDFGLNDNSASAFARDRGRGYLNFGIRWSWGKGLTLGLDMKDVLKNQRDISFGNRTLRLEYVGAF